MSMREEKQTSHVGKRTSLSETYEELCLIPSDEFDKKILIHEHLLFQKKNTQNWTGSTPFNKATLGSITKVIKGSSEPSWRF